MAQPASIIATRTNQGLLDRTRAVIAGGGSSNMRIRGVQEPLVVDRASGCRLWDVEGRSLIDVNMGYGPHLFGYADPEVAREVGDQFASGAMTGLPHHLDHVAGELIAELVPSVDQVRFANSGTEAITSAIRLARAYTGRSLIVTFEGHYHGWSETVVRKPVTWAGQSAETDYQPLHGAPGMIPEALSHTLQLPWNDFTALGDIFTRYGDRIAAVILEPICANMGVVPPVEGFIQEVSRQVDISGALLIFDEVITGFRLSPGGAQELFSMAPDITILSKVLGGGFPVAAFGGSAEVMAPLARNEALHAGVYAGNHAAMRAVVSVLRKIQRDPGVYAALEESSAYLEHRLREQFLAAGQPVRIARAGSVMSVALLKQARSEETVRHDAALTDLDPAAHQRFQLLCQREGVYFHPDPLEPWFISSAHTQADLDEVLRAVGSALAAM